MNKNYQRSDQVWPDVARSFLIESILLGFPVPKIYLHSITDLKSRITIKEIVDGQQRSRAIYDFFYDKLTLSNLLETEELRGLSYSELPEDWQSRFVSSSLSIDLFLAASTDDVIQVFRRMNSYTVPLNPEELRHAEHQGPFKWFVYEKSSKYAGLLADFDILSSKSLVRMQDLKLYAEILYAVENGISTTNKKALDSLYIKYNKQFPVKDAMDKAIEFAFSSLGKMRFLKESNLTRPHLIYSLCLALIDSIQQIPNLDRIPSLNDFDSISLERRMLDLSASLELGDDATYASPLSSFVLASRDRTNVKAQRETRVHWFMKALAGAEW